MPSAKPTLWMRFFSPATGARLGSNVRHKSGVSATGSHARRALGDLEPTSSGLGRVSEPYDWMVIAPCVALLLLSIGRPSHQTPEIKNHGCVSARY